MQASDGPVGAPVVLIGDLAVSDNPAVVSLWEESELTRPWNDPELDIRRALAGSSSTVLTARDGTVLAGTVMVGHDGHRGWVYYLAVASSYRSHGVAGHLMSAAEQWLRSRGAVKVQLMVRKGNAGVGDLYVHLGYEEAAVTTYAKWLVRRADDWVRAFTDAFSTASDEVLAEVQLVEAYDLGRGGGGNRHTERPLPARSALPPPGAGGNDASCRRSADRGLRIDRRGDRPAVRPRDSQE